MPVILNGKNLVGGELNGKKLKAVYNGDRLIWQAAPAVQIVGSSVVSENGSIAVPTGTADGDLLIYYGGSADPLASSTTSVHGIRYRVAASEPASYSGVVGGGGIFVAIRGVNTDPGEWISASASTSTAPSLVGDGALLFCRAVATGDITAVPAGMVNLGIATGTTKYAAAALLAPPNPTGTRTFTATGTTQLSGSLLLPAA